MAAAVASAALVVYRLTLFPGLTGIGDSAKFQYIGSVLGTAHNPGYPLYVLLTFLFSHVRVGSVAFRVNLFSAIAGACAVAVLFLALRRTGASRPAAVATSLAFAFGATF